MKRTYEFVFYAKVNGLMSPYHQIAAGETMEEAAAAAAVELRERVGDFEFRRLEVRPTGPMRRPMRRPFRRPDQRPAA